MIFSDDQISFCAEYPAPKIRLNLESWQRNCGYDRQGKQVLIDAEFDPEELTLTLEIQGEIPAAVTMDTLREHLSTPGPWHLHPGRQVFYIKAGKPTN